MTRVKVKKITPKGMDIDQDTLTELFEQMTGVKDADTEVIIPKYVNVMILLKKFYKLYELLCNLDAFANSFSDYSWTDEILLFIKTIKLECDLDLKKDYTIDDFKKELHEQFYNEKNIQLNEAELKLKDHINNLYRIIKNSQTIKKIMITSANLSPFKVQLSLDNVSDSFIKWEPGNTFIPLAFTTMDLKLIWNSDIEPKGKKFLLSILQHTFKISYEIYDIIYSPDVDIAQFSDLLVATITKLRGQIPRCDKAFDVIENSVNMLRSNFKDYFRLSVESENPSTILESFIVDVASSQKANPSVVGQFRKITAFMKKNAANTNDPRVKQLFKMLNTQFTKIDKELGSDTNEDLTATVQKNTNSGAEVNSNSGINLDSGADVNANSGINLDTDLE